MSASPFATKRSNDNVKKHKRTTSDSDSEDGVEQKPNPLERSSASVMKEIKATFDFKGPKDFHKIRILGKGGVGRVYLVQLKGSDKLFAMKVLKQEEMISRNKVKRVLTEREVLATTKHPLIISLYYSFQSRSRLYFVMDYCAGGEFYRTIQMQPHKCLTEDQMRFYAAEVLLALEYLHAMGFVYRDLKPENILLHASGHIRLTDFDLSKASATPVNAHVVQSMMGAAPTLVAEPSLITNSFVGTEEYLAPEVIVGKGYGASVDWWTFGILMYEMLYGVTPFRGKSQPDTFHRIEKSQVKFPDHARGPVSKECKSLIKKLLCHDPKKRLGYEQGAAEIKAHPFFEKINLQLILNSKPPIIPTLDGPQDFRYFSTRIVDDDKDDEDMEFVNPDELPADHPFKQFSPVDREVDVVKAKAKVFKKSSHSSSSPARTSKKDGKSSKSKDRTSDSHHTSSSDSVRSDDEDDYEDSGHTSSSEPEPTRHIRRKKSPSPGDSTTSPAPAVIVKHRARPDDDDSSDEVPVSKHTKIPRSKTPVPTDDDYPTPSASKHKHKHTHSTASDEVHESHSSSASKLKKSSLAVPAGDDGESTGSSLHKSSSRSPKPESTSHSRHSSTSKRSETTEGDHKHSEKPMKKVSSNLSEELETVSIHKSSSKRSITPHSEEETIKSSSRKGTPTTTSKKSHRSLTPSDGSEDDGHSKSSSTKSSRSKIPKPDSDSE